MDTTTQPFVPQRLAVLLLPTSRAVAGATLMLVGLIAGPEPLRAQNVGDRVRVTIADGTDSTGQFRGMTEESIELFLSGGRRSFARSEIVRLERSQGIQRQWKRGMTRGGGGGFVVGFGGMLLWYLVEGPDGDDALSGSLFGGAVLGAAGAFWGGLAGLLIRREVWETIPLANPTGVTLNPLVELRPGLAGRSRTFLGMSVQF